MTTRDDTPHRSMNLDRARAPDDPLRVVIVGAIEDGVEAEAIVPTCHGRLATVVLGEPADADTLDSMWRLVLEADVVVGLTAIDDDGDVITAPMVAEALAVAVSWTKPAILCTTTPRPHEKRDASSGHPTQLEEMTPAETRALIERLAQIDWHAPNAVRWRATLEEIDERLPATPHRERVVGGIFAGLPAYEVLETVRRILRGAADPLTILLSSTVNAVAVPENLVDRMMRNFALGQEDRDHWFRWPDGFVEWSKNALAGLRRTEHPAGYFDRAMRDVRAWDLRCVAELLRRRAARVDAQAGPGATAIAAELRLVADVVELAVRVGEDGSIDPEAIARARAIARRMGR
jgi:hypothetical protein